MHIRVILKKFNIITDQLLDAEINKRYWEPLSFFSSRQNEKTD